MTQKEKINMLKDTIVFLYEKEGRSKKYISELLKVDRKILTYQMKEWELIKADKRHLTPSSQKFLNKNKQHIIDMLNSDVPISEIAQSLKIDRASLIRTYIQQNKELLHYYNLYKARKEAKSQALIQNSKDISSRNYNISEIENEVWMPILGYENYEVSNMGRVRKYIKRYRSYYLLSPNCNCKTKRYYVTLYKDGERKNFSVARLVAHSFVDGYSNEKNTVDHLDGNIANNKADNLEWVSYSENNMRAYTNGKCGHKAYTKNKKFRMLKLDNTYEFKTIRALGKFLGVSETQAARYISGETKTPHKIEFVC